MWGHLSIGGKIILKKILKTGCRRVEYIELAQDRVQWWDLVNTVPSLRFHKRWGIYHLNNCQPPKEDSRSWGQLLCLIIFAFRYYIPRHSVR
jgi:hypothetical protein